MLIPNEFIILSNKSLFITQAIIGCVLIGNHLHRTRVFTFLFTFQLRVLNP